MKFPVRRAAGLTLAAVAALAGCYPANSPEANRRSSDGSPLVMQDAPPLKGVDMEGKPIDLQGFKGKVVLVDFWMTN